MEMMKKTVCFLCSFLLALSVALPVFALPWEGETSLYNVYGDGMLFRQNSVAALSGKAKSGAEISAQLTDQSGETLCKARTMASRSGDFTVSLSTPAASYTTYRIDLYENGTLFQTLNDVVFGELWLASGQSNMQYGLPSDYYVLNEGEAPGENAEWIRAALVPAVSTFDGRNDTCPVEPQRNIEGVCWAKASSVVFQRTISAVAYYFANKLQKQLDVPVGIINASLGGSAIETWLSRDAIEADAQMKEILLAHDGFIAVSEWIPEKISQFADMTANFNTKIAPFRNFTLSGMIWYQGETNIIYNWSSQEYIKALDSLQRCYGKLFGFEGGRIPLVYTQLASYVYGDSFSVSDYNSAYASFAGKETNNACITISDIGLEYTEELGPIHPARKKDVGERMADSACGLVYGKKSTFTAACADKTEVRDNAVYVTFRNTGDGLAVKGKTLEGFAVCGSDGRYCRAKAELVSKDTVKLSSPDVKEPVGAAYAYYVDNDRANLYSTENGVLVMPVSCFATYRSGSETLYTDEQWMDCEKENVWHNDANTDYTGFHALWKGSLGTKLSFTEAAAFSGERGLEIDANGEFFVSPVRTFTYEAKRRFYTQMKSDYSDTGSLTFMVKNAGQKDLMLSEVRFYTSAVTWYTPAIGEGGISRVIPADSRWHEIKLDLNSLYFDSNESVSYTNNTLKKVTDIRLCFTGGIEGTTVCVDGFAVHPEQEDVEMSFAQVLRSVKSFPQFIKAVFTRIIERLCCLLGM